jgi:hypothetical protein
MILGEPGWIQKVRMTMSFLAPELLAARSAAFLIIFGVFRSSSEFGPKGVGSGIIRDDATLSGNPAFERLANLGGILLGDCTSCQGDCQDAEKKSHTSHTTHNKKIDP